MESTLYLATLLLADDDTTLRDMLSYSLRQEGYRVLLAEDGLATLRLVAQEQPDLVILDLMLPKMSGFDVCRAIRRTWTMPILILSAREDELDKVLGLELGADDYLTKPFRLRELLARIRALLRRVTLDEASGAVPRPGVGLLADSGDRGRSPRSGVAAASSPSPALPESAPLPTLITGDIRIDLARRAVWRNGALVPLQPREFDLLAFLAQHPGRIFRREALLTQAWGYHFVGNPRMIDVYVRGLRSLLEVDPANPQLIQTVRGAGYLLDQPVTVQLPSPALVVPASG